MEGICPAGRRSRPTPRAFRDQPGLRRHDRAGGGVGTGTPLPVAGIMDDPSIDTDLISTVSDSSGDP